MDKDRWLLTAARNPAARVRLYGFPYAGAGASMFRDWHRGFDGDLEISGVQLPGRENRFREPRMERVEDAVDALLDAGVIAFDRPFFFFGHSLGALVAFEVARGLRRRGLPGPFHLAVSGTRAPMRPRDDKRISELDDPAFLDHLLRFGGTPDEVSSNPEVMDLLLPQIRADFAMFERWSHSDPDRVACPVTAFGGDADPEVSVDDIRAWADATTGCFRHRIFPGDHFFIQPARLELFGELRAISASAPREHKTEVYS